MVCPAGAATATTASTAAARALGVLTLAFGDEHECVQRYRKVFASLLA